MMKIKMFIGALLLGLATGVSAHHQGSSSNSQSGAAAIDQSQHNASISTTTINEAPEIPVATAYAPGMAMGADTCQFTRASGGLQLPGGGVAGAVSEESEFCRKVRMAKLSAAMGDPAFGHEILCGLDDWKKASDAMGGMTIGVAKSGEMKGHLVKAECTETVKLRKENEARVSAGLEPTPAGVTPVDNIVFGRSEGDMR